MNHVQNFNNEVLQFCFDFCARRHHYQKWGVTGRQENTKFLPAAALFTGKQFVSSDV